MLRTSFDSFDRWKTGAIPSNFQLDSRNLIADFQNRKQIKNNQ
jgi:hypothetical protein